MSFVVRPSRASDLDALYEMAKLTGGGFTNLPPDRRALRNRLKASEEAFGKSADVPGPDIYLLILENLETGRIAGTAQIFAQVGQVFPFYSYRLGTLTQHSRELERTFRAEMLTLTTDYEGASEVGGLFLHPRERAGGLGLLLARSRYLFIRQHRARFAERVIAELRGVIDEAGGSPFWDGLAGKFFGMGFQEADEFNAVNGHQFIADLMPKHPIYIAMLPEAARHVIGLPHPSGRAAMKMLEAEGFRHEGYVDIFDGGPTMAARTDTIRSIAGATIAPVARVGGEAGRRALVATGRLTGFRCAFADLSGGDVLEIDAAGAAALGVREGDEVLHVER
ncbi:arginine N-succinyltransferase [Sphingomonas jatrophae]|uniref:Arginine N-succinyltransferase n=1 Tax=Sphingomonas jatrophae TaxID=1166337 RepID=A0A1I6M3I0_9SPHN|nr:arginine N-succinyltransferase [Sphingomonas jatrophae]SFS10250.1 arginine N-succinyltransferase [Sphingomonas jatrophae]